MNAAIEHFDLHEWITTWDDICSQHKEAIGENWALAERVVGLHTHALQAVGTETPAMPLTISQRGALALTGAHAIGLVLSSYSLLLKGQLDVYQYLTRGLFDLAWITFASAEHSDFANRVIEREQHLGSKARRLVLREHAAQENVRRQADYHNISAHLSTIQIAHSIYAQTIDDDGTLRMQLSPQVFRPQHVVTEWMSTLFFHASIMWSTSNALGDSVDPDLAVEVEEAMSILRAKRDAASGATA